MACDGELPAVLGIDLPRTGATDLLADLDHRQGADDSNLAVAPVGLKTGDGKRGDGIVVGEP